MSKKTTLVLSLVGIMMTGGCNWVSTAHQVLIHTMSLAAGISGLNDLFNLGL
jgi:hypothetical protein